MFLRDLPTDIIDLIYYKLHQSILRDLHQELLDPDHDYAPSSCDSAESYSCTESDSD